MTLGLSLLRIDGNGSSVVSVQPTKQGAGNRGVFIIQLATSPSCGSGQLADSFVKLRVLMHKDMTRKNNYQSSISEQHGFTLLEAAIALVILMIIGLGIASLFTYAIKANSSA